MLNIVVDTSVWSLVLRRRRGLRAGTVDYLIAAACIEHGFPLLTRDRGFLQISRQCELLVLPPLGDAPAP